LSALEAFRKLVEGVYQVHKQGLVHRDIKLQNIFVSDSGDLLLGDFGIVFVQQGGRQTTTFEMVGSHFWMAPWAYKYERLSLGDVTFALDLYRMGKVLWSMIAGRSGFAREEFNRDENNLEKMFPLRSCVKAVPKIGHLSPIMAVSPVGIHDGSKRGSFV
jgi:serine/threonine-protein kinase